MYVLLAVYYDDSGARHEGFVRMVHPEDVQSLLGTVVDTVKASQGFDKKETAHALLLPVQEDGTIIPPPHPLECILTTLSELPENNGASLCSATVSKWKSLIKAEINKDD